MKKITTIIVLLLCSGFLCYQAYAQGQGGNSQNTSLGMNTLFYNSTGTGNTGVGYRSLYFNSTGNENSAVGLHSLYSNSTGNFNTAHGASALYSNTSGSNNTATGWHSLYFNTTGWGNTATGLYSLLHNTSGGDNTAQGVQSLFFNTTGAINTAIGANSLVNNTTGGYNTGIGGYALYSNTGGGANTALGLFSLTNNTNGAYNTAIGVDANVSNGDLFNATAIGFAAIASASNSVRVGNSGVTSIGGQVGWTTFSDGRYKNNVKNDVPGLEFIKMLKPVTYNLNVEEIEKKLHRNETALKNNNNIPDFNNEVVKKAMNEKSKIVYTGFIAQDVEKAAMDLGYKFSGVDKPENANESFYGLRYDEFVVPLVKAVQELAEQNNSLKTLNEELEQRLEKIEKALAAKPSAEKKSTVLLSSAKLEQNMPNPANRNTVISYSVPSDVHKAEIRISGQNGELIKNIEITPGVGKVNFQTSFLNSGTYTYSLVIDEIPIDTKKMLVIK